MWWYDAQKDRELKRKAMLHDEIEYRRKKILEETRQEGHQEGIQEEKIELAKNFKEKGIDISIISDATGLSIQEIKDL